MQLDPNDPVVALCGRGMEAEADGRPAEAADLFQQAWEASTDDLQAATAAHYVARYQDAAADTLTWNQRALDHADRADPERVAGFYPSLHLNLGRSFEDTGDLERARQHYLAADRAAGVLGDDPYGDLVRDGIARALARTADASSTLDVDGPATA